MISQVSDQTGIVTHGDPARRDATNFIILARLDTYGMPGALELFWTRTQDQQRFELCCIPFFTYELSLGDVVSLG